MSSSRPNRSRLPSSLLALALPAGLIAAASTSRAGAQDLVDDRPEAVRAVGPAIAAQMQLAQAQQPQGKVAPGDLIVDAAGDDSLNGRDPNEGVFVRDSAMAVEKISHAQRMVNQKEWENAASLYQEVLEKYPDRVVPSKKDKDGKIYQYTSVTNKVREALSRWPAEGRQVYRNRYEATAAAMLESAKGDDVNTLNKVLSLYFLTDAGRHAAQRLVDVYLERGEYHAAARTADALLEQFPKEDLGADRPGVLYRAALAHQLAGDPDKAKQALATLQREAPDAKGLVRGKEVALAGSLEAELKAAEGGAAARLAAVASSPDSYRMPGGGPSRGRVSSAAGKPGALLYSIELPDAQRPNLTKEQRRAIDTQFTAATGGQDGSVARLGIFPVTDRGELYFQDGQSVFAVSLESGVPLPGWVQTYGTERGGRYTLSGAAAPSRFSQNTLTLTEDAVFGVMGQSDLYVNVMANNGMFGGGPGGGAGEPKLVSLDRRTGRENWVVAMSQLPDEAADLRQLQPGGSPLVVGDNVLVAARGTKQAQFEDCWVLCFGRADGKYRWSCYIASANNLAAMMGMVGASGWAGDPVHLSYADGRVYVLSDLGAVAALDAYAGTIVWLDIYPTDRGMLGAGGRFDPFVRGRRFNPTRSAVAPVKPWLFNPPVVDDGRVFVLPDEGKYLFVYDAGTGAEVKRILKEHLDNANVLLGASGDQLYTAGTHMSNDGLLVHRVLRLNWQKYDADRFTPNTDESIVWATADFGEIRGRCFLTADSLYVPTPERLWRIKVSNGMATDMYPPQSGDAPRTWSDGEGPGNVLVTGDHVVIAGATDIDVYTDLNAARQKLEAEVAAAPTDPNPRLRYAEVMFVSGQLDTASAKLDEAINLLGGPKAMQAGPARDRVFSDALTFAQKLSGDDRAPRKAAAGPMFDRAAAAANSPQQQVEYRLSRARHAEAMKDAPSAVKLYQEILADARLRPEPRLDESTGEPTQAHAVAERAIRTLIERAGRDVYAPFEQAAADALKQATAEGAKPDPAGLLSLAQTYPLAQVAPQALMAAADAYESTGNPKQAVQSLRQLYFKYPEFPGRALVLESMARNYLTLPNRAEVAAARLAQGAALPDGESQKLRKPLRLPDGREIKAGTSFPEALAAVRTYRNSQADKSLPDFGVPLPPTPAEWAAMQKAGKQPTGPFLPNKPEDVITNVAALAQPLRDFARTDRVVAWSSDGTLSVFAAGRREPLGTSNALPEPAKGSAWAGGADVLVWGPTQIALVPETGGPAKWKLALKDQPNLEVVRGAPADGQGADAAVAGAPNLNGQVMVLPGGRGGRVVIQGNQQFLLRGGQAVAIGGGGPVAQPAARPAPGAAEQIAEVRPVGDRVILSTTTGRLLAADLADGKVAWQTRLSDRPFDRLVANEEFAVARLSDEAAVRMVVLDSYTGQPRGTRTFPQQPNVVPQNMALAPDGTLVYTLPDRLVLKDLYKPWADPEKQVTTQPGQYPFLGATAPDQLVISEGRILALSDDGGEKYVRVHSLETGLAQPVMDGNGKAMEERRLGAGTKQWNVSLRPVGPHLYVFNGNTVRSYNLDRPEDFWEGVYDHDFPPTIREAFVGQKYLALLDESPPTEQNQNRLTRHLLLFGRYPAQEGQSKESGRLDYLPTIEEPGEIDAWQAVDGGFYYHSADGKLHLLRGAATAGK